ncbi:MAG TPA: AMP-binding protein, partial [Solirubrobacteraceae bacterium]
MDLVGLLTEPARRGSVEVQSLVALVRRGMVGVELPHRVVQIVKAINDYGINGAAAKIAAIRHGDRIAIADERGEISFKELDERIDRLANALIAEGVPQGASVGILCRNHRQPLIAAFAASRGGFNAVWLNTSFSAPQAKEVVEREKVDILVHDEEFAELVADITSPGHGLVTSGDELDALIDKGEAKGPPSPEKAGKIVLLTSGTTGTPKGAPRAEPRSLSLPGALLDRMPMKARETTVIGPPLYHGTGLIIALLALALGHTLVLRRKFDAAQFLDDTAEHGATTWCVVPVMLQRVLALGDEEIEQRDLSSLRVVFCAGSQLPAEVATKAMDLLGDVIYNLYGSTEVSVATLATPADIRAAPTSVGKPALGSKVKIFDDAGKELPQGESGRIFVG